MLLVKAILRLAVDVVLDQLQAFPELHVPLPSFDQAGLAGNASVDINQLAIKGQVKLPENLNCVAQVGFILGFDVNLYTPLKAKASTLVGVFVFYKEEVILDESSR